MADGYVAVPPDASGKKIDTTELLTTAGSSASVVTVERQRVTIPDSVDVNGAQLIQILTEQRVLNNLMVQGFGIPDSLDQVRDSVATDIGGGQFAYLNVPDQTLSGGANVTSKNLGTLSGTVVIDCGLCPLQYGTNGGTLTIAGPIRDGSTMLLITNGTAANTTTFTSFTVGTSTGDSLTTTVAYNFTISIWRINGVAGYRVAAHQ